MLQSGWKCLDVLHVNFIDRSNKYSLKEEHCRWGGFVIFYLIVN